MNYLVSLNMPRLKAAKYDDTNQKSANKPKRKKSTSKKSKNKRSQKQIIPKTRKSKNKINSKKRKSKKFQKSGRRKEPKKAKKLFCLAFSPNFLETNKFVPFHLIKSHLDEVTCLLEFGDNLELKSINTAFC